MPLFDEINVNVLSHSNKLFQSSTKVYPLCVNISFILSSHDFHFLLDAQSSYKAMIHAFITLSTMLLFEIYCSNMFNTSCFSS